MPRKRMNTSSDSSPAFTSADDVELPAHIFAILAPYGITPPPEHIALFVQALEAYRHESAERKAVYAAITGARGMDILGLIVAARNAGDLNEAIWRAFLAVHFGRQSAKNEAQEASAGRFLCGFGNAPMWTWERTAKDLDELLIWLHAHEHELQTLMYGSHRKYESKQPDALYEVISSCIEWVNAQGGTPFAAMTLPHINPEDYFHVLYKAFKPIAHFGGRLGRFDLASLLGELHLLDVVPDSTYLEGASGPLDGAKLLLGRDLSAARLTTIADDLAKRLAIPYDYMETALCDWPKLLI